MTSCPGESALYPSVREREIHPSPSPTLGGKQQKTALKKKLSPQKEIISRNKTKAAFPSIITATHLPAHGGLLAGEDVLCERRRLQLIFVEGEVVNHHGLLAGAGELHIGVSTPRRLGKGV